MIKARVVGRPVIRRNSAVLMLVEINIPTMKRSKKLLGKVKGRIGNHCNKTRIRTEVVPDKRPIPQHPTGS